MLQYVAVCCSVLQCVSNCKRWSYVYRCDAVCCSMLQYVAVCCSVCQSTNDYHMCRFAVCQYVNEHRCEHLFVFVYVCLCVIVYVDYVYIFFFLSHLLLAWPRVCVRVYMIIYGRVFVYVYVCMWLFLCDYVFLMCVSHLCCGRASRCVSVCKWSHVWIFFFMCTCERAWLFLCDDVYPRDYVCICLYVCIYDDVCIHDYVCICILIICVAGMVPHLCYWHASKYFLVYKYSCIDVFIRVYLIVYLAPLLLACPRVCVYVIKGVCVCD